MWLAALLGWLVYIGLVAHRAETTPPVTQVERVILILAGFPIVTFALMIARHGEFGAVIAGVPFIDALIDWSPWLWLLGLPFFFVYGILVKAWPYGPGRLRSKEWLTPHEAARLARTAFAVKYLFSSQQILELGLQGKVASMVSGSNVLISATSLIRYLSSQPGEGEPG